MGDKYFVLKIIKTDSGQFAMTPNLLKCQIVEVFYECFSCVQPARLVNLN